MNETMKIIFGLVGGLAIFIYGMNMMSECLQKAAGEKMKKILALLTKNPILGVLAGALTTAVLQSSSATTVMTIGFVSAGLMSLPQAISIILGANIGTTMTAQIIAFKITDYIYLFIFAGFLISFISKKEKVKNIGQTIFAFGLLFLGIDGRCHETIGIQCILCQHDWKSIPYSDSWGMRGCRYDTCCTEQQCNDCRITEFCSPGRTGRCDQYYRTGRCHPDSVGRQYRYNDYRSAGIYRTAKRCQKDGVCPLCI